MNLIATAPAWLAGALLLLLALAALQDGLQLRISDFISGAVAIGAFIAIAFDGPAINLWENLLLFGLMLVAGTFLFARGAMGGGDVKLLAASVLWFDLAGGWKLLVAIALAGGIETLVIMALRRMKWPRSVPDRIRLLRRREGIPYGIAIAAGVAMMAAWLR